MFVLGGFVFLCESVWFFLCVGIGIDCFVCGVGCVECGGVVYFGC